MSLPSVHPFRFDTLALHAGYEPSDHQNSAAVPVYQTSSYVFDNAQHGADLFDLAVEGNIYSRVGNPTVDVLEQRLAALEGGAAAVATASGMAAIDYAVSVLAQAGDHIIATTELYGGTHNFFRHILSARGIKTTFVDKDDFAALEKAITPRTKAVFFETVGNPSGGIADAEKIADISHRHGVVVIADNTAASPASLRPLEYGVDVVVHSATKYIGGHGNTLGGVVVDGGRFDWIKHRERYPQFSEPDNSYHGIVFTEHFPEFALAARLRTVLLRNTGAALAPNSAFLLLQGLETIGLRVERIARNTEAVVDFLSRHDQVGKVHHVSLPTHRDHHLLSRYAGARAAGILSFEIKGGRDAARAFYDALGLFLRLVNIGDSKSLAAIPAETTHHQLSETELLRVGITPNLVRLSIGIEDKDDLLDDLNQALSVAASSPGIAEAA